MKLYDGGSGRRRATAARQNNARASRENKISGEEYRIRSMDGEGERAFFRSPFSTCSLSHREKMISPGRTRRVVPLILNLLPFGIFVALRSLPIAPGGRVSAQRRGEGLRRAFKKIGSNTVPAASHCNGTHCSMSIELTARPSSSSLSSLLKCFNNSRDTDDGVVHPPGLPNFSLAASLKTFEPAT